MLRGLALWLALMGAVSLAHWSSQTPTPSPATSPGSSFSAARAMVDDRIIAAVPHPVGSTENRASRDYLIGRMTALGLSPQVQRTQVARRVARSEDPFILGATVENIVGVWPGRDRAAPALALMAHYDSVPASPGAADDAAGVSAALEVIRALKLQGTPARDVVVLITDGEEAGLLGAEAFFKDSPLAKHIGFVVNMETRGGGGQAQMFQTGPQNGQVIDLFAKTAVRPQSSSLAVFLYEHMPNDTDFTVSNAAAIPGLNYAFIGRQFDYHSATSTSQNLDQGSLQDMGDQVLAVARPLAFGQALPGTSPSLVYSSTFGSHVLAYPPLLGWLILIVAAGLTVVGVRRARRRNDLAWADITRGVGLAIYLVLITAVLLRLARRATGVEMGFIEQRTLLAQITTWEIALLLIALGAMLYVASLASRGRVRPQAIILALGAGAACSAFGVDFLGLGIGVAAAAIALWVFRRSSDASGSWAGLLGVGLALGLVAQALAAPTAFLIAWPLLAASTLAAMTAMGTRRAGWGSLLICGVAIVGVAWLLSFAHGIFLGLDLVELLALISLLATLLLWPLAHGTDHFRRFVALALLLAGFGTVAWIHSKPPWTPRFPQATMVYYLQDLDNGTQTRIAMTPELDPWSRAVVSADGGIINRVANPLWEGAKVWSAPAKVVAVDEPSLALTRQSDGGLRFTMVPPPGTAEFGLDIRSKSKLDETRVDGRPVRLFDKPGQWSKLRFSASPQGTSIDFRADGPGQIEVRFTLQGPAWPKGATPLPKRDALVMAFDRSDTTITLGTKQFSW